jgi:serine protease Do
MVVRQSQVKEAIGPLYAGDKVAIAYKRGDELLRGEMTLVDKLEPYTRPFLGILPMRLAVADEAPAQPPTAEGENQPAAEVDEQGVVVRFVYPGSPALEAGLEAGDRITQANGKPVTSRAALRSLIANSELKDKIQLTVTRGGSELNVAVPLAQQPEAVPDKLPAAMAGRKPYLGPQPPVGVQPRKLAEYANEATIYVPEGYDPAVPHGMVIWFHGAGELQKPEELTALIDRWKPYCDAHDLILVIPRSEDASRWVPAKELPFAAKLAADVRANYRIDDTRIVAAGFRAGAAMAWALAGSERDLVRAVAAIDVPPISSRPPENDPQHPLSIVLTKAEDGRAKPEQIAQAVKVIRGMKYPVTLIDQGASARHLNDSELEQLIRWIDSLDRI